MKTAVCCPFGNDDDHDCSNCPGCEEVSQVLSGMGTTLLDLSGYQIRDNHPSDALNSVDWIRMTAQIPHVLRKVA